MHRGEMKPLEPSRHDTIYVSPTGEVICRVAPFKSETSKQFAQWLRGVSRGNVERSSSDAPP